MHTAALFATVVAIAICVNTVTAVTPADKQWISLGPRGSYGVQSATMKIASATSSVKKTDGAWLLASVNGGVWRTTNKPTDASPTWTNVWDNATNVTCQSVAALHVSKHNNRRVYAGCGATTSSIAGFAWNVINDGPWNGVFFSNDAGVTWSLDKSFPAGYSVQDIVELKSGAVLIATRGSRKDQTDGGVWRYDGKSLSSTKVYDKPVFSFVETATGDVYASGAAVDASEAVLISTNNGLNFKAVTTGLVFPGSMQPFYSALALSSDGKSLFLLALLTPSNFVAVGLGGGLGSVNYLDISSAGNSWKVVGGAPTYPNPNALNTSCSNTCTFPETCCYSLDGDFSAKDRAAITVDPTNNDILYVAANGGFIVWRVDWRNAIKASSPFCTFTFSSIGQWTDVCLEPGLDAYLWTPMTNNGAPWRNDTVTDAAPHIDCRSLEYDTETNTLLLTSDGGVFVRTDPSRSSSTQSGSGIWSDWIGDLGTLEHNSVAYDARTDRFAASAQDNCVQLSKNNVTALTLANKGIPPSSAAFAGGDGTMTAVDSRPKIPRFFGATQFLNGLGSVQTAAEDPASVLNSYTTTGFDLSKRGFPLRASSNARDVTTVIPFFQNPYVLNRGDRDMLCFWANATKSVDPVIQAVAGGVYCLNVSQQYSDAVMVMDANSQNILDLVVGGRLPGSSTIRSDIVVAATNSHLLIQIGNSSDKKNAAKIKKSAFPRPFAAPLASAKSSRSQYCQSKMALIIVPCTPDALGSQQNWPSHSNPVSMAVAHEDANVVAVTGWANLDSNDGTESIFYTNDGGTTFVDIFNNLGDFTMSTTKEPLRPLGLSFLSTAEQLVAGTVSGMFFANVPRNDPKSTKWYPLGRKTLPLVKIQASVYLPDSDDLVIATFGRGIYRLKAAGSGLPGFAGASASSSSDVGKKVGIALGVTFGVLICAGLVWYVMQKRKHGTGASSSDGHALNDGSEHETYRAAPGV